MGVIADLDALDLKTVSIKEIQHVLSGIGIALTTFKLQVGRPVFRARKHPSTQRIHYPRDLSYRTDLDNIGIGRANDQSQSIFYAALASVEIDQGLVIATMETSSNFRNRTDGIESFTVGRWKVVKEIELAMFVFNGPHAQGMMLAEQMTRGQNEVLEGYPPEFRSESEALMSRLSREFGQIVPNGLSDRYKISAAMSCLMYKQGFAGVMYPSVQTEYKGFNVALLPSAAEEYLKFNCCMLMQLRRSGNSIQARQYELGLCDGHNPIKYVELHPKYAVFEPFSVTP